MKKTTLMALKAGAAPFALGFAALTATVHAQTQGPVDSTTDNTGTVGATGDNTAAGATGDTALNEDPNAIVVTGSRISRPDLTSASPVTVVSREQLRLSDKPGVEEFLRQIPQAVAGLGQNNNNGNEGTATVNLRNLGEVRTLVLVDGQRFVPYDSRGVVDLNMIPSSLIKRVEVVTGGASAVYGSDAVAGVVNFVLDHDFTGIEGNASAGVTQRGDGSQYTASLTAGLKLGDRGHIIASGSYTHVDLVTQGDRGYSTFALSGADLKPGGGSSTNAFGSIDLPTAPPGFTATRFTFTPNGFIPYNATRDSFNFNPQNLLQVPQEKYTATVIADYALTDDVEFFARGSYGKSKVRTDIGSSGTFGFSYNINYATNPYLDPAINPNAVGARAILARYDTDNDGIVRLGLRRRVTELGPRSTAYESEAYQFVGGLKGDFGAAKQLHWQVFGQYGKTKREIALLNDVSLAKSQQALLVVNGPNGPQCVDTSGGCLPANLFGIGTLDPAAARFFSFSLSEKDKNDQVVVGGFVNGDLPFGFVDGKPAAFVLGAEYRKETAFNLPDDNFISGQSVGYGASSIIDAKFNVKEVYGELKVPILADRPFFQSLNLEAGFRYSDYRNSTRVYSGLLSGPSTLYKNSFTNWTYKFGGDWQPVEAIRLRAMYQRAVRSPNLQEIGQPRTSGTGDALFDPCAQGTAVPSDTTLYNLCLTVGGGVPIDPNTGRISAISQPTAGQVNNFSGGNPNLVPEKADTLTLGAVLNPPFLKGFTASIDYFDIKVKKAILETPEQAIIDACYYAERNANGLFCSLITRNESDGSLEGDLIYGVDSTRRNIGLIQARGLDVNINYNTPFFYESRLLLGLALTRTFDSKFKYADVLRTYDCAGLVGKTCKDPQPKWRWIQTTGVEYKQALLQLTWRHIGSFTNDTITGAVGYFFQNPSAFAVPRIKSYDYFDLALRFRVNDDFTFRVGVDNIGDRQPPIVGNDYGGTAQNSGNTFPATYDPLGRYFHAGVTFKY